MPASTSATEASARPAAREPQCRPDRAGRRRPAPREAPRAEQEPGDLQVAGDERDERSEDRAEADRPPPDVMPDAAEAPM